MASNFDNLNLPDTVRDNLNFLHENSLKNKGLNTNAQGKLEIENPSLTQRISGIFFSSIDTKPLDDKTLKTISYTLHHLTQALKENEDSIDASLKTKTLSIAKKINDLNLESFDENQIAPLRQSLLEISAIIDEEMHFIQQVCPELATSIMNAQTTLKLSEDPQFNFTLRQKCTPQQPPEKGVSGSYFVSTLTNLPLFNHSRESQQYLHSLAEEDLKTAVSFVVKPSNQEPGYDPTIYQNSRSASLDSGISQSPSVSQQEAALNLGVNLNEGEVISRLQFKGITPGSGVIRERIGYKVQTELGVNCGIPPTAVTRLSHEMFAPQTQIHELVEALSEALGGNYIELNEVVHWLGPDHDINNVIEKLGERSGKQLEALLPPGRIDAMQAIFQSAPGILTYRDIKDFLNSLRNGPQKHLVNEIIQINLSSCDELYGHLLIVCNLMYNAELITSILEEMRNYLSAFQNPSSPSLVSVQQFIPECRSLLSLLDEEKKAIPPDQYSKFVIDLILINQDRHLGNILTRPIKKEALIAQFIHLGIDEEALQTLLSSSLNEEQFITQIKNLLGEEKKFSSELHESANNLYYAHTKGLKEIRELVLIDHGACLPDASELTSNIANHSWSIFLQDHQLSTLIKSKIQQLDITTFISAIQEDQQAHAKQFGVNCEIPESCYHLMQLNLMWLQTGIKHNLTLQQLNAFGVKQQDKLGEMFTLYMSEIHDKFSEDIDWQSIQNKLEIVARAIT